MVKRKQSVNDKDNAVTSSETPPQPHDSSEPHRKKRMSRKEQKARKKQHQQLPRNPEGPSASSVSIKPSPPAIVEDESVDYFQNYVPTPIPESLQPSGASLGKWFPKAKIIKSSITYSNDWHKQQQHTEQEGSPLAAVSTPKASLVLFYQYATPHWTESQVSHLLAYLTKIAESRQTLGGRIRVAPEGVNVTVSSVDSSHSRAAETLRHFCRDLQHFSPEVFGETDFKFIDNVAPDRHFKDLKLLPVQELVFYGISSDDAPLEKGGVHLDAKDFHDKLQGDSTVVVDVRNHYEAAIGRMDGQQLQEQEPSVTSTPGATYVDPKLRKSTDFPIWLAKPETQEQLKDKTVLMYCTGGVRCERASAYLNTQMGSQIKGVYQLKGGIERYLQAFPDGGYWRGKNFVFDKREAIGVDNRDGDGGVVVVPTTKKKKAVTTTKDECVTHCCLCKAPWDRYIGKKKCHMCGVPVLMCDACMSNPKGRPSHEVPRCPLCVEQGITVPAADVEYTKNGVSGRLGEAIRERSDDLAPLKVAPSVLKWGGGHASKKKEQRRMKRKLCQFGVDCVRKDCFFSHPERKATVETK